MDSRFFNKAYSSDNPSSSQSARREGTKLKTVEAKKSLDLLSMQSKRAVEQRADRTSLKKLEDQQRIKAFNETFETTIKKDPKGVFEVRSYDEKGGGYFLNEIEVEKGRIIGNANYKYDTKGWYLSDVIYNQLQLALKEAGKDIPQFNLKSWYDKQIGNEETKAVAESCFAKVSSQKILAMDETDKLTFEKGSDEFNELMKTATAKSKFYLLKDNFPGKQVMRITVYIDNEIDIDYQIE